MDLFWKLWGFCNPLWYKGLQNPQTIPKVSKSVQNRRFPYHIGTQVTVQIKGETMTGHIFKTQRIKTKSGYLVLFVADKPHSQLHDGGGLSSLPPMPNRCWWVFEDDDSIIETKSKLLL